MRATEVEAAAGAGPVPTLSLKDAVAITVGIVVGAGIFRTPSLVAANVNSESAVLLSGAPVLWLARRRQQRLASAEYFGERA